LFPNTKSGARNNTQKSGFQSEYVGGKSIGFSNTCEASSGSAARFFYCAKSSKSERNKGTEELPRGNDHATVKPLKLMQYLVKLVTPPKGTVLDPFMGSGTTGIACKLEGFKFIGIEKESDYIKIAKARIHAYKYQQTPI